MIINWYTDPSKGSFAPGSTKFSSFYQYNTVTKQFVRVRLELGRRASSSSGDGGDTKGMYKETREVGFSDQRLPTSDTDHWSIEDDHLCFDHTPLDPYPTLAHQVYDCSDVTHFVHRGNPVTDTVNLPPEVTPTELELLANHIMITKQSLNLSNGAASPEVLSAKIKLELTQIMNKDIKSCSESELKLKLIDQSKLINSETIKTVIEREVQEVNDKIASQIELGETPTPEFQDAFLQLKAATAEAINAGMRGDFAGALDTLQKGSVDIEAALSEARGSMQDWEIRGLDISRQALEIAAEVSQSQVEYEAYVNDQITEDEYHAYEESEEAMEISPPESTI